MQVPNVGGAGHVPRPQAPPPQNLDAVGSAPGTTASSTQATTQTSTMSASHFAESRSAVMLAEYVLAILLSSQETEERDRILNALLAASLLSNAGVRETQSFFSTASYRTEQTTLTVAPSDVSAAYGVTPAGDTVEPSAQDANPQFDAQA